MTLWFIILLVLWAGSTLLTIVGTHYVLKTPPRERRNPQSEPISILKPLKGFDSGLLENLESFFQLDYPLYELLISVADAKDPANEAVRALLKKYPEAPVRLLVGEVIVGNNPKVNNLIRSYEQARYDFILISDSNTRVSPDYLWQISSELEEGVGVATGMIAGRGPQGFAGMLESTYLNTFFARWIHLAAFLQKPFVIGKSMCFRRGTAERFGGIRALAHVIAEDNMFGEAVKRLGLKVTVMAEPIGQHIGNYSLKTFWSRHVRWGRIRKAQAPFAFLFEPFVTALLSGVLGALAVEWFLEIPWKWFLSAHLLLWAGCDLLMIKRLKGEVGPSDLIIWAVRELLALPHWFHMALGNRIHWRGAPLQLSHGGVVAAGKVTSE